MRRGPRALRALASRLLAGQETAPVEIDPVSAAAELTAGLL